MIGAKRRTLSRTRRRGTASVEVIMMLPFFFIVFAGIYFMYGMYIARQHAMLRARSCTWSYAAQGCQEDHRNALLACLEGKSKVLASASETPKEEEEPKEQAAVGNGEGPKFLDKLSGAPVIGGAIKWLFGVPIATAAREPADLAYNLTPRKQTIMTTGKYFTMCNTVPKPWGDVAIDVFCGVVGKGFVGCD